MIFISFMIGFVLSIVCLRIIKANKKIGPLLLKLLVIFGFLLTWYKDGDFFLSLQGSIRLYLYLLILIFALSRYHELRRKQV